MAKLTSGERNALPPSSFGLPKQRKYPMQDLEHAVAAKGRATQAVKAGRMSPSTKSKIVAKADRKLGKRGA